MPDETWNNGPESEVQEYTEFPGDIITEDEFRVLTDRPRLVDGQYRFKITKVERLIPTSEKPMGGDKVHFGVVIAPPGVTMPDRGWPNANRLFRVWLNPTDGQKKAAQIDYEQKAQLIRACGIQGGGGNRNIYLELQKCVGREVLATVSTNQTTNWQDVQFFKPV
jgi:hypothetical protein